MDESKIPENLLSDLVLLDMPSDPVKSLKSIQKAKTHSSRIKTPFDGNANDEGAAATRSHELLSAALSTASGKMNSLGGGKKKSVKFESSSPVAVKRLTPPSRTVRVLDGNNLHDDGCRIPFYRRAKTIARNHPWIFNPSISIERRFWS